MAIITPAIALMTDMIQAPIAWRQDTTAPMLTVGIDLIGKFGLCVVVWLFVIWLYSGLVCLWSYDGDRMKMEIWDMTIASEQDLLS